MTLVELALAYNLIGSSASIISAIDTVLKLRKDYTAENLFKECFIRSVRRKSRTLAHFTKNHEPKTVDADRDNLNRSLMKMEAIDTSTLASEKQEILRTIAPLFRSCLILPGHQLTDVEIDQKLLPILENTIADFYSRLPLTDKAFKQLVIESTKKEHTEHKTQSESLVRVEQQLEKMAKVQTDIEQKLSYLNPTVIQKESGRAEFRNPFRIVKAEDFDHNYPLLASLFKKPANYDLIRGRDNLILAGGRGCGKSMILRSLSAPTAVQIEAHSRNLDRLSFKDAELDYFGVYIKLAKGCFGDLSTDVALKDRAAAQLFQHAFNIELLKEVINTLLESRDSCNIISIPPNIERSIVEGIGELLGIEEDSLSNFANLKNIAVRQRRAIGDYLATLRLGVDANYSGCHTYVHDFPREFCRILLDSIPDFENARIYFLLDEFENLAEFQQTVVNTITKLRPDSLTLKIATRILGVKSRIDLQGEPIQSPRDYQVVLLDHDVGSREYVNLVSEISERRLQEEKCSVTDIGQLLPSLGSYPELGEKRVKELVSAFLKESREIDFSKAPLEQQKEWRRRWGVAMTFRENSGKKYPKLYAGFGTFVEMSSGIISNFLELCKMAFYLAEMNGQDVRAGESIDPEIQNEAVYLVSRASLDWISSNIPQTGPKISQLVLDLGDIFREKLLEHSSEPEAARIVIKNPERLENPLYKNLAKILEDAERWSVLHSSGLVNAYSPRHKSDVRPSEYTLNRILIPTLKISPRLRWRTEFRLREIADLIDSNRRAQEKRKLIARQGKKQREVVDHPPSLFDPIEGEGEVNES